MATQEKMTYEIQEPESRGRRCRTCHVILMLVIVAIAIAAVVLLIIYVPRANSTSTSTQDHLYTDADCIDVAIIGAGIGGSYTGWRLRNRGLSISIFEYTDRVGGRLFSKDLPFAPGVYVDFGGMRFKASSHRTLNRTISEIGLKIIPFPLGKGNPDETLYYVRGTHLRNYDLGTSKMPYQLKPSEFKDPNSLIWDIVSKNINFSSDTYPSLGEFYSLSTNEGFPVFKMSVDNFYAKYASHEAYKYIYDTSGWEDSIGRIGALAILKMYASYPGDTGSSDGYKTVDGGLGTVPPALMENFTATSSKHKLHLNRKLLSIERVQGRYYRLLFQKTESTDGMTHPAAGTGSYVCAKKVILALQKSNIEQIHFPTFSDNPVIKQALDSVINYSAGRIYLAYKSQWWKTNSSGIRHSRNDLPIRQTYDWATSSNGVHVIMASYHDGPMVSYWREWSKMGTPIPGSLPGVNAVTDVVKERAEDYLSQIYNYNRADIPPAVGGAMMLWDTDYIPAAWSYYKPGFDEQEVRKIIPKPSAGDDVYIISNSWAADGLQGWSEGTLLAANVVLDKYFK